MLREAEHVRPEPVLTTGRNCWRIEVARRLAFLVDGQAYFSAFAAAVERARHSVVIVGWDVHGDVRLHRDGRARGLPDRLGPFLNAIAARRPGLHVYVLDWDFAMIYAFQRQRFPIFELGWRTHPRVRFAFDGNHPPGASHHQKLVVVDDAVAFVGGFDLAPCRWDTRAHLGIDPRRVDPGYAPYPPFHDVQVAVAGDAARALGELARDRWWRATGRRVKPAQPRRGDPWPPGLAPALVDVPLAIARSAPAWDGRPAIVEVEQLWLDAIAAATRTIYLETQYLTSTRIAAALAERLTERDGPEIVIVTPRTCCGWLEETTMGVLRARILARLEAADRWQRLRVYAPCVPGDADTAVDVNVHSKILVVDDRILRIGSSNASNRSLRLDSECDVALEAGDATVAGTIVGLRDDLVGEHLGVPPADVARAVRRTGSLAAAIERLRGGARTLRPFVPEVPPWMDSVVPEGRLIDSENPVAVEDLVQLLLPQRVSRVARRTVFYGLGTALGVVVAAGLWRTTPLATWVAALEVRTRSTPPTLHAAAATSAAYVVGGVLVVPVHALLFATGLIFPPRAGFIYALMGSMTSAVTLYGLGKALPRDAVRLLAGPRLNRVGRRLAGGALAVARVRLMPAAPFTGVNLVAGAAGGRVRDFALGTALAMAPGAAATVFLARRFLAAHRQPSARGILGLIAATALVPIVHAALQRVIGQPELAAAPAHDRG